MIKPKRTVDIDGLTINAPQHYHSALQFGHHMIDQMEAENVDRSDMQVAVIDLYRDLLFHIFSLRSKQK